MRRAFWGFVFCLGFGSIAWGQVEVRVEMTKREYLLNEPVLAKVTVTNRAGRDLTFHGDSLRNWLELEVIGPRGVSMTQRRRGNFRAMKVRTGGTLAKVVNLSKLHDFFQLGGYSLTAVVRLPKSGREGFVSNRTRFSVATGREIFSQRVGAGVKGKSLRKYRLLTYSGDAKTQLYFEVEDGKSKRVLQNISLGEVLLFRRPDVAVDGKSALNVLYMITPEVYRHLRISPEGKFLKQEYHKLGVTGNPRLVTFANGEVKVAGSVPYDPKVEAKRRKKQRKLSDRPSF